MSQPQIWEEEREMSDASMATHMLAHMKLVQTETDMPVFSLFLDKGRLPIISPLPERCFREESFQKGEKRSETMTPVCAGNIGGQIGK